MNAWFKRQSLAIFIWVGLGFLVVGLSNWYLRAQWRPGAMGYVRQTLPRILISWDYKELLAQASPELLDSESFKTMPTLFKT